MFDISTIAEIYVAIMCGVGLGMIYALWAADRIEKVSRYPTNHMRTISPMRNVRGPHPF